MRIRLGWRIAIVGLLGAGISVVLLIGLLGHVVPSGTLAEPELSDAIWAAHLAQAGGNADQLEITYPFDEALFPPEIAEPTFRWQDKHTEADTWLVTIEFADGKEPLKAVAHAKEWTPSPQQWGDITARSVESRAKVIIVGFRQAAPDRPLSSGTVAISTSKDKVGATLFFREVNLPFLVAVTDPAKYIRWRFGPISAREPPPIVMEKLPVCGNCHSFSRDGATLAMEVDSGNEKGGYAISPVSEEMVLDPTKVIDWNDYKREDGQPTFGLLCQVSPDGKYVAGTVKDRALAVYRPDLMYSQLFFLVKGIMAIYDREAKTIRTLPGADDPEFVQTNGSWSPDGKYIVFARSRSKAIDPESLRNIKSVLVPQKEAEEFLEGGKTFLFDLYRIPFNNGKGGKAEPIEGASNDGMRNYFAKYSPDGKWIVFCKAKSFMLLQPDSQLYVIPAAGGQARRLRCNTSRMNSWHSWSPNGKWLAFSSKVNGAYTQLLLTHMDEEGNSTPPVVLDRFTAPERAANIPEFVNQSPTAIRKISQDFMNDHSYVRAGNALFGGGDVIDAERMFRMAIKINPRSVEAHTCLAKTLMQLNQPEEALKYTNAAVDLGPKSAEECYNLGLLLTDQGKLQEAIAHYKRVVQLDPKNTAAHYNLGTIMAHAGRVEEAIVHYERVSQLDPKNARVHDDLGTIMAQAGKMQEAVVHYQRVVQLEPQNAETHNNLGTALALVGRLQEAFAHYKRAVELQPDYAKARSNLSGVLAVAEGTIRQYEEAVRRNPDAADLRCKLGNALMNLDRVPEATRHFERAVQLDPKNAEAHNNLAWLLATRQGGPDGDSTKAVSLAERACELTENRTANCLGTLAAAYAAAGRFPEAVATAEKAIQVATSTGQAPLAKQIGDCLECYRAGRAYGEPPPPARQSTP